MYVYTIQHHSFKDIHTCKHIHTYLHLHSYNYQQIRTHIEFIIMKMCYYLFRMMSIVSRSNSTSLFSLLRTALSILNPSVVLVASAFPMMFFIPGGTVALFAKSRCIIRHSYILRHTPLCVGKLST